MRAPMKLVAILAAATLTAGCSGTAEDAAPPEAPAQTVTITETAPRTTEAAATTAAPAPPTTAAAEVVEETTAPPATETTAVPVVDVTVEPVSDHCGQPAVGEPITGTGDSVEKIQLDAGAFIATIRTTDVGHFAVKVVNATGQLDGYSDNALLANEANLPEFEAEVAVDVEVGGDFRLEVSAEQGSPWTISFREF